MKITELIQKYDALLIDAYGVLVHEKGAYPFAPKIVNLLNETKKPFLILTNDASRLPSTIAQRFQEYGMDIPERLITSSGSMLIKYFENESLVGKNTIVLGTADSTGLGRLAGGNLISPMSDEKVDVVIVGDEKGFPLLDYCDFTLTKIIEAYDEKRHVHLIIPNPDAVYPKQEGFGIAAGGVAVMIEHALHAARPDCDWRFESLGKPKHYMFENAFRLLGTKNVLMVGDQLQTDIRGACDAGIDSLLVMSGVALYDPTQKIQPTFICDSFSIESTLRMI